jgi:hypothetical protein
MKICLKSEQKNNKTVFCKIRNNKKIYSARRLNAAHGLLYSLGAPVRQLNAAAPFAAQLGAAQKPCQHPPFAPDRRMSSDGRAGSSLGQNDPDLSEKI